MIAALLPLLPTIAIKLLAAFIPALAPVADAVVAQRKLESEERQAYARNAVEVRKATAGQWEQRLLAFIVGAVPTAHFAAIGIGTTFVAPFKKLGHDVGWWEWLLYVPPMPPPFDKYEGPILLSFYGLVGAVAVGQKIAGAYAIGKLAK